MAHVAKYARGASGHLGKHYERAKDEQGEYLKFGNQDIDSSKTDLNYNLGPNREISQTEFIRQRCDEVRCLNRKDVNVMCDWVVTAPKNLENLSEEKKFFEESYNFLENKYGKENVVSAYVHKDENQPHMHFSFVPVVEDKTRGDLKVSAKECLSKPELQRFHGELDQHMQKAFGRDVGILNEATKEGNKEIHELKQATRLAEARELAKGIGALEKQEKSLQGKIEGLQGEYEGKVLNAKGIDFIEQNVGRSLMGKVQLEQDNYQNLIKTARQYTNQSTKINDLEHKLGNANSVIKKTKSQVENLSEAFMQKEKMNLDKIKKQAELERKGKAFDKLPEDVQKELLRNNRNQSRDMGHER